VKPSWASTIPLAAASRFPRRDSALRMRQRNPGRRGSRGYGPAAASGLKISEQKTIEIDRYSMETSRPRFFAGGDVVSGASNLSTRWLRKESARNIDERLMGVRRWAKLFPEFEYAQEAPVQRARAAATIRANFRHTNG